jgi:hypothetical protein
VASPRPNLTPRVLAVLDDEAAASRAVDALLAAGLGDVQRLHGPAAADAIDAVGRRGLVARLGRAVQFTVEDQMPALAWYEAALREGRTVLALRTASRSETKSAVDVLVDHGAHFINRFGRLETEELARWRGPEPAVHDLLK